MTRLGGQARRPLRHRVRGPLRAGFQSLLARSGYELVPSGRRLENVEPAFRAILPTVLPYTMTSPARLYATWQAAAYVARRKVPGAIVECGVWRGGSMMAAAHALLATGAPLRELYLFDTFTGMTPPGPLDRRVDGASAAQLLSTADPAQPTSTWCVASLAEVQRNLDAVGYARSHVFPVVGPVEETLPGEAPDAIAVLRLDTDWYESTRHELEQLYPRISPGGVLIVDDYGWWAGARRAVDEFFAERTPLLLHRIDSTGRIGVLPG